jgi:phosphoenolpyruvate carboxykinase (ATP)
MGVTEPQATFSPCFGGPFLVWHPMKYAGLLAEKVHRHKANVWLVNTGWSGGAYGTGKRMKLAITRAIIDGIHSGQLKDTATSPDPVFGIGVVKECAGVPSEILQPRSVWTDKSSYEATARKLAGLFKENFKQYESGVSQEVREAGPKQKEIGFS